MSVKLYPELSHRVIGACFNVHNCLGSGLPEAIYQKALEIELEYLEIPFKSQAYFPVHYKGQLAGQFLADFFVGNSIILEIKAVSYLREVFKVQLLNYMRLGHVRVGYLVNFQNEKVEFERFII